MNESFTQCLRDMRTKQNWNNWL